MSQLRGVCQEEREKHKSFWQILHGWYHMLSYTSDALKLFFLYTENLQKMSVQS